MNEIRGLIIKKKFDASHFIDGHQGGCANLHGHTYHAELHFAFISRELDEMNMLIDFKDLDKLISSVIDKYDHAFLNELYPYGVKSGETDPSCIQDMCKVFFNPTAEFMAEVLYKEINELLIEKLDLMHNPLKKIVIWETDKYAATYEFEEKE